MCLNFPDGVWQRSITRSRRYRGEERTAAGPGRGGRPLGRAGGRGGPGGQDVAAGRRGGRAPVVRQSGRQVAGRAGPSGAPPGQDGPPRHPQRGAAAALVHAARGSLLLKLVALIKF